MPMDLAQAAWMVRDLGQPVSSVDLEDDSVIAGGWNGLLKKWNGDGDLMWSVQCSDRIEAILRIGDRVIVTSGLHIHCIKSGEIEWTNPLEGSADMLACHGNEIIATSSVYDIEHCDFMESAVWKFSLEGIMISVERMDERPWFIDASDKLVLGLGRPRCGLLVDGEHKELGIESPVTCGTVSLDGIFLGHADGTISSLSGEILDKTESSVDSIVPIDGGLIAALECGKLVSRSFKNGENWSVAGLQIATHTIGFDNLHWCSRWDSLSGLVEIRDNLGKLIVSAKMSRPRVSDSSGNRISIGFDDGQVIVWERELFQRRLNSKSIGQSARNSTLAAKLRSLRK